MTKQECGELVTTAAAYHPNTFRDESQIDQTVTAWYYALRDVDFKAAMNALVLLEATGKLSYFPTVGMIRNAAVPLTVGEHYLSEAEAVTLWRKAMANGNYHAQEEFDKLPPEMQRAIGSPDNLKWDNNVQGEFNMNVEESHFRRVYNVTVERMKSEVRTPIGILRLQAKKAEELLANQQPPELPKPEALPDPKTSSEVPEKFKDKYSKLMEKIKKV